MKKVLPVPKILGDSARRTPDVSQVLNNAQPNLVSLAQKVLGSLSLKSTHEKKKMYKNFTPESPYRRRHLNTNSLSPSHIHKVQAERIVIEGDILYYSDEGNDKVGVYIGESPISDIHNYFEVEILEIGVNGAISIGLCPSWYPLHKLPGWIRDSIGYHTDDGKIYKGKSTGANFGPKCVAGDRIGCGVKLKHVSARKSPELLPVFFTKNGTEIGTVHAPLSAGGLFPCVGLVSEGDSARLLHPLWPGPDDSADLPDRHPIWPGPDDSADRHSAWKRLHNLTLNGQCLEYCGKSSSEVRVGFAQARRPLTTARHFFQVEVLNPGKHGFITVGVAKRGYARHYHPGWNEGSVAYRAGDGRVFEGSSSGTPFGPPCKKSDVLGCGVIFPRGFVTLCQSCGGDCPSEAQCEERRLDRRADEFSGNDAYVLAYSEEKGADGAPLSGYSLEFLSDLVEEVDYGEVAVNRFAADRRPNPVSRERHKNVVDAPDTEIEIFFTHNSKFVGRRQMTFPRGGIFPTVGLGTCRESIRVDLHPLSG